MAIQAVIFDFGGVLVRTEDRAPRQGLADSLGMTYDEVNELIFDSESARRATVGEITTQEHWETLRVALNLSAEEFPRVPKEFFGGDVLDEALLDYIRDLRPRYKTGLLSNAWDDLRGVVTDEWQIADAFDELIISAEVGVAKPDAGIYELTLERLDVAPPEAVFVDDFPHNIAGAQAVGLHAIHFQASDQVRAELDELLYR
jgi:epoxide hydrolase-like predicted phosphatase